ncbi:hypothetical protein C0991_011705 [Blastosporella zonata]|nr:hypothetical protein C0991_011705 [Blastosporella zonata]
MPPRLNKRQQRELEELSALGPSDSVSSDEALGGGGVDGDGIEEDEDPSTSAVGKSGKVCGASEIEHYATEKKGKKKADTPSTPPKNEKKAAKRAKAKEKKAGADELEQALA